MTMAGVPGEMEPLEVDDSDDVEGASVDANL
jgi:hypothetical protein